MRIGSKPAGAASASALDPESFTEGYYKVMQQLDRQHFAKLRVANHFTDPQYAFSAVTTTLRAKAAAVPVPPGIASIASFDEYAQAH